MRFLTASLSLSESGAEMDRNFAAQIRQSERRLSSIYETVADTLFYIDVAADRTYHYASVNPAFLATTGLTYEQVVGKRIEEVLPAAAVATVLERFQQGSPGPA